ncbi:MAG: phospholipid carrier-dependent glycosyltransferase [Elusimicrobiaceae bacterium]|nr:phospholipid carrier-dependent glycosyltransferase [Elusimicrobiaceae bacterium]
MNPFQQIAPILNVCILTAFAAALYSARREISKDTGAIRRDEWLAVTLALAAAITMQSFCELKHLVYIDEFWYLEAGKNILRYGMAPGFGKSIGWPVLVTFSYIFGGISNYAPIALNLLFGAALVPLVYLSARALSRDHVIAAVASFTLALLPYRAVWSATAETAVSALFFILCGVYLSLLYYRSGSSRAMLAAAASIAAAAQIRPECLMFLGLFWFGRRILSAPGGRKDTLLFYAALLTAAAINLPNFSIFAAFQSSTNWLETDSFGQIKGASISLKNLWFNTKRWAPKFFDLSLHGGLFTALYLSGAAIAFKRARRELAFAAFWAGMLYCFYFSTWFHVYGTTTELFPKTKLFLFFYPALGILAGYAVSYLLKTGRAGTRSALILAVCALGWNAAYIPRAGFKDAARALETGLLANLPETTPESCMIITNAPVMVNASGFFRTAYAPHFTADDGYAANLLAGESCLLYLDDITNDLGVKEFNEADRSIKAKYRLRERVNFSLRGKTYRLLTVIKPAAQPRPKI